MVAFGRILAELDAAGVEYMLVGGLAVGTHGYVRATKDVDVLVPATRETAQRLQALLERLGATRPDGSPLPVELFDGEHHIRAQTPFGMLDIIPEGEMPLDYESLRQNAIHAEVDGIGVQVIGLEGLVTLKRLAGRPVDQFDLSQLEIANGALPDSLIDPEDL